MIFLPNYIVRLGQCFCKVVFNMVLHRNNSPFCSGKEASDGYTIRTSIRKFIFIILCSLVCRCIRVISLGLLSEVLVFKVIFIDNVAVAHLVQRLGLHRRSTYLTCFVLQIRFYLYRTYIKKLYMIMFIHYMVLLRRVVQSL